MRVKSLPGEVRPEHEKISSTLGRILKYWTTKRIQVATLDRLTHHFHHHSIVLVLCLACHPLFGEERRNIRGEWLACWHISEVVPLQDWERIVEDKTVHFDGEG